MENLRQAVRKVLNSNFKLRIFQGRWSTFGHLAVRLALMLILFTQVNYMGCRHYRTRDLSRGQRFTLSGRTRGFVKEITGNKQIISFFLGSSDILPEVKGIITEFDRVGGEHISAEFLDLSRSRDRIAALRNLYQLEINREQIAIIGETGRLKVIPAEELAVRDPASGRLTEFRGEEKITAALLEVTEAREKKIYLVQGNRRGDQLISIAKQLETMVKSQNAVLDSIRLDGLREIPTDADALILAGNTTDLSPQEASMVKDYWDQLRGGLLIWLDPEAATPQLHSLLRDNGVIPNADRVLTFQKIPGLGFRKITAVVPSTILPGSGPARDLPIMSVQLKDRVQSLTVQSGDELILSRNVRPAPLMAAVAGFWGETEYAAEEVDFNPEKDNGYPKEVYTAAAIEKADNDDPEFKGRTSRLVVVGCPNLISPDGNYQKNAADFCMASLNWIMNRDQFLGIAPRQVRLYDLAMPNSTFSLLQTLIVWLLPAIFLFCGALVWYKRRA